jgi:D-alanyl-D-alanine carboxypeptidase/D-alanyl-D-alanine-endopeptidase (penicillin-binding protein 4)
MDGMSVNHNAIDVWVIPPRELNCPPVIDLEPITNDETVKNEALGAEESDLLVIRPTFPDTPAITIRGKVSVDSGPRLFQIPVLSPPHFAGRMLMAFLEEAKIEVKGKVAVGQMPPECEEVASHTSAPLSEIVEFMMKGSDNLYADMLFKKIGEVCFQPPGSWQKGSQAVREFLRKETNIDPGEIVVLDGSGISRYNLMTPHQLTQLLMWGAKEFKLSPEFMGSLPISGVDGSLQRRMLAAKSKIRAKTGVMTGISTIAGYVSTKSGDTLVFAIMMNGLVRSPKEVKQSVEDEICVRLTL